MLNVTNIIIFLFILTLTHYVITRFLRFPEVFFLLYAVAIFGGFGAGNLKMPMLLNCRLF